MRLDLGLRQKGSRFKIIHMGLHRLDLRCVLLE